jgi:CheY-like chemotaxis protein
VRQLRVLLVEDDEDHVFLVRRALRDLEGVSASVAVASNGEQALEELGHARFDPGSLPHLVLLDLRLPRVDGLEVLRRIRADPALHALPVVVLTLRARRRPGGGAAAGCHLVRLQAHRGRPLPRGGAAARRPLGRGPGLSRMSRLRVAYPARLP